MVYLRIFRRNNRPCRFGNLVLDLAPQESCKMTRKTRKNKPKTLATFASCEEKHFCVSSSSQLLTARRSSLFLSHASIGETELPLFFLASSSWRISPFTSFLSLSSFLPLPRTAQLTREILPTFSSPKFSVHFLDSSETCWYRNSGLRVRSLATTFGFGP